MTALDELRAKGMLPEAVEEWGELADTKSKRSRALTADAWLLEWARAAEPALSALAALALSKEQRIEALLAQKRDLEGIIAKQEHELDEAKFEALSERQARESAASYERKGIVCPACAKILRAVGRLEKPHV
jgi:hypothetical protein